MALEDDDKPERDRPRREPPFENGASGVSVMESVSGARIIDPGVTLDAATADELRREFLAQLALSMAPLVVDLSAVRAIDAEAASAVLIYMVHEAGDADVDLRVVRDLSTQDDSWPVLTSSSWFEVYRTVGAALQD